MRGKGSLRSNLALYHRLDDQDLDFGGSNLLMVNIRNKNRKHAKCEVSFDVLQPYGAIADAYYAELLQNASFLDTVLDTIPDITGLLDPLLFDLRKLSISLYTPYADISVGRQIINFGKGFVFSPMDVYSSVDITDLNFRRSGSDVLRLKIPFGALSGADVVTSLSRLGNTENSAVKLYTNLGGYDLSAVGIYDDENYRSVAGLGFKGDLFLGVYGELVETFKQGFGNRSFKSMLGLDYSWENTWFAMVEYYYREKPGWEAGLDFEDLIYGKHNLFANLRYQHNELLSFSANTIFNTLDQKALSTVQVFYNLFQNTDVTAYIRHYSLDLGIPLIPDLEYAVQAEVKF